MEIRIITVGKIKEKYLSDGIAEYAKRLGRYCKLNFCQVADEKTPDPVTSPWKAPDSYLHLPCRTSHTETQ